MANSNRDLVKTALLEAGAAQEAVDDIEDVDLDALFHGGWKKKSLILNARQDLLVSHGVSPAAVSVIVGVQGEPLFRKHRHHLFRPKAPDHPDLCNR